MRLVFHFLVTVRLSNSVTREATGKYDVTATAYQGFRLHDLLLLSASKLVVTI
jgi:hypothetical protein